ncbi:MAG: hypothetical protein ABI398_04640 [Devosia sp.]
MLKLTLSLLLVATVVAATPALADTKGGGTIGAGCTINPWTHVMRCVDFDHCTKNSKGERVCPVIASSVRQ